MRFALLALAFNFLTSAAFADSIAIYRGRLGVQQIYRNTEVNKPTLNGYAQNCYAVVRLGAGGELAFVNYHKNKSGKTFANGARTIVSLNIVGNAENTKGQCVLSRGTTLSSVNPSRSTIWNIWADGLLSRGLRDSVKVDRDWTRVLAYEENFGYGNHDAAMDDYNFYAKGFLIMDDKLTKAANTANGGSPESFEAALTRVRQALQAQGYSAAQ